MAHKFFMFTSNVIFSGNNTLYESVVLLGCLPSALTFFLSKFIADQKRRLKIRANAYGHEYVIAGMRVGLNRS